MGKARSARRLLVIPRTVSKVVKEYRRYAKDERVRIVSHAKTAGIPAEVPVVSVDQVRDGPDQRPLPHVPCEVGRVALKPDFVGKPVLTQLAKLPDPGVHRQQRRGKVQVSYVMRRVDHGTPCTGVIGGTMLPG